MYHWLVFASNEYLKKQFVGNVSATLVIIELAAISIPQRDCWVVVWRKLGVLVEVLTSGVDIGELTVELEKNEISFEYCGTSFKYGPMPWYIAFVNLRCRGKFWFQKTKNGMHEGFTKTFAVSSTVAPVKDNDSTIQPTRTIVFCKMATKQKIKWMNSIYILLFMHSILNWIPPSIMLQCPSTSSSLNIGICLNFVVCVVGVGCAEFFSFPIFPIFHFIDSVFFPNYWSDYFQLWNECCGFWLLYLLWLLKSLMLAGIGLQSSQGNQQK